MRRAAVSAAFCLVPLAGLAQDVTLTSRDGTLTISGSLQGFDGELYRVATQYGLLTLDAQGVLCEGPACPDMMHYVAELRLTGPAGAGEALLPALLAGFAGQKGLALREDQQGGLWRATLFDPEEGYNLAHFTYSPQPDPIAIEAVRLAGAEMAFADLPEPDLNSRTLGLQALVAIVAPGNPLAAMATTDLARVLSGKVANWSELGGPDMPMAVHGLAADSSFRRALERRLGQAMVVTEEHASLSELAAAVARDPWAIALTSGAEVDGARVLALTDSCGFTLNPARLSVKAEDYPLTQPLYLLTAKRRLPLVGREFMDYLATPAAAQAVASAGLIDRGVEEADLVSDGLRLANAIRAAQEVGIAELQRLTTAMQGARRLSLTFRFEGGAKTLDAASRDNLADLVRLIEAGQFRDKELVFVGFSDGSGGAEANLELSRDRADVLREAVAAAVPDLADQRVSLAVEAFGEAMPMACDESPVGRQVNRRVELWVRATRDSPPSEN